MEPIRKDIAVRTDDVFREHFAFVTKNGRAVEDLAITNGSTSVSCPSGFLAGDSGKKIVAVDGVGISDGTTLTVTGATTGTLSAAATATREGMIATIDPVSLSSMTGWKAQMRQAKGATAVLANFTVTTSRASVGIITVSLADSVTVGLTQSGSWDLQASDGYGHRTLIEGIVSLRLDVSRA